MNLRAATPADLPLLQRWDDLPHVLAADPNDDWGWAAGLARQPDWREWLIAEVDGRPIAFVEIMDPARDEDHYWGEVPANLRTIDIWIGEAADLGKGYGTQVMQLALARCFAASQVTAVLVDPLESNTRVHPFYERLGFHFVERRRFGLDDCRVYRLERADYLAVRDPDPAEFGTLQRLWFESWQDGHARILPEEVKRFRTFERFADRLKAVWPTLRIAGPRGYPLGLCAIKQDELWQLFVGPAGRGTGVANALLADGEQRLAASGVKVAWLACAIGNDRAARFYEKCGWHRAGTTINSIEMPGNRTHELEVWKFEKQL